MGSGARRPRPIPRQAGGRPRRAGSWPLELQERGVELAGPEVEAGTGTVVSVATPDGARTMLSDRGVSTDFAPDELDDGWLDDCEWLHVPGYSLVRLAAAGDGARGRSHHPAGERRPLVHCRDRRGGARPFPRNAGHAGPARRLCERGRGRLVGQIEAERVVVKRGAEGCVVLDADGSVELPAVEAEVVDSTGAGDAFAAGFLLGGPDLGLDAAARCVAKMGAMP